MTSNNSQFIFQKGVLFLLFIFCTTNISAEKFSITGTVQDTSAQKPLQNAVAMAVRLNDSLLVAYTRSNESGMFRMDSLPLDTYQVIISHPLFGDHTVLVMGNNSESEINLHKIVLPPKSIQLNEVTVYGYADPVYFKGDTLVYTADSFQVKPNAVVEDLLKKLPGIKVDAQGKIYSQGKAVDQVLVDGDEFFGSDPTIATKNLAASGVESVQVYDKKNEDAADGNEGDLLKIMDLKLKEDAKKGYFGKISAAHDYKDFYEGELLLNKFKGKQKISLFALGSNTPRTGFGWGDMQEYGLSGEQNSYTEDDGTTYYYWDQNQQDGIPRTFKTGAYYTDMLTKTTKVSLNYTYKRNSVNTESSTASQYFLSDTTYRTNEVQSSHKQNNSHAANLMINQKLDSLNELELKSKFIYGSNDQGSMESNEFITESDTLTRRTDISNTSFGHNYESNSTVKWTRSFDNRDRKLVSSYNLTLKNNESDGNLKSENRYFNNSAVPDDSINQQKVFGNDLQKQFASVVYTEPVSKKVKLEFSYDISLSEGTQKRQTYDVVNGLPSTENATLSNEFENRYETHKLGTKIIYEVKKQSLTIGSRFRNMKESNHNLVTDERLSLEQFKVLPSLTYRYKFSDNKQFNFRYFANSRLPDLNQLQPVPDNSNPNYVMLGNPDLLPSEEHNLNFWLNSYQVVSGNYTWINAYFNLTNNSFTNDVSYDSIGRTITRPVNADGNYYTGLYFGSRYSFFSKWLEVEPNIDFNHSRQTSYINGGENVTKSFNPSGKLQLTHSTDSLEFNISAGYSYHDVSASLSEQSNQKYSSYDFMASFEWTLPLKFRLETEATYTVNRRRVQGYNINTLIWNASLKKNFLKNDNLIASIEATDMLNESVQLQRNITDNVISDVKANIVGRYILLKVVFKFNSNKKKDESEED